MSKKVIVGIIVLVVVIGIAFVIGIGAIIGNAINAKTFSLGDDVIATLRMIDDNLKASSTSSSIENGISQKTYKYNNVNSANQVVYNYYEYLKVNENFLLIEDTDFSTSSGTVKLAKRSSEEGKIIMITVSWEFDTIEINAKLGKGTLTAY